MQMNSETVFLTLNEQKNPFIRLFLNLKAIKLLKQNNFWFANIGTNPISEMFESAELSSEEILENFEKIQKIEQIFEKSVCSLQELLDFPTAELTPVHVDVVLSNFEELKDNLNLFFSLVLMFGSEKAKAFHWASSNVAMSELLEIIEECCKNLEKVFEISEQNTLARFDIKENFGKCFEIKSIQNIEHFDCSGCGRFQNLPPKQEEIENLHIRTLQRKLEAFAELCNDKPALYAGFLRNLWEILNISSKVLAQHKMRIFDVFRRFKS